jgi:hypothetical protein
VAAVEGGYVVAWSAGQGESSVIRVQRVLPAAASEQTGDAGRPTLRMATGIVKSISMSSIVLERRGTAMTFYVLENTRVQGRGRAGRDLLLRRPDPITRVVKAGDEVRVTYRVANDGFDAVEVLVLARRTP